MVQQIIVVDFAWYYWALFLLAAIIGSTASSLTNNSGKATMCGWEGGKPNEENGNPGKYCLGIIADILIGIAAALGILWTLIPQTTLQLIGIGTVAGYGGSSILRALTNKLDAQLSQQKANEFEKKAKENKDEAIENKNDADSNKKLSEKTVGQFLENRQKISDIKEYLLKNHKEVLNELYKENIVN